MDLSSHNISGNRCLGRQKRQIYVYNFEKSIFSKVYYLMDGDGNSRILKKKRGKLIKVYQCKRHRVGEQDSSNRHLPDIAIFFDRIGLSSQVISTFCGL